MPERRHNAPTRRPTHPGRSASRRRAIRGRRGGVRVIDVLSRARRATRDLFEVLETGGRLQVAFMSLAPGQTSGEPSAHVDADQLIYVLSGTGKAEVAGRTYRLPTGSLAVIPAGAVHQIRNTGTEPMTSLNVYAPPEYAPRYRER